MISVDRLLSMGSMTALAKVREYSTRSNVTSHEAAMTLRRMDAGNQSLDFEAALHLDTLVEGIPFDDYEAFYRVTLKRVIERERPQWTKLASAGRSRLCEALPCNIRQSLRAAGLLSDRPSLQIIQWWDEVASVARSEDDKINMENGRLAEYLSMEREEARTKSLGLLDSPRWVSLEDNSAGYDILSFDLGVHGPTARMIEVKSCSSSEFGFYLSRGQWETAKRSKSYIFHLWNLPNRSLLELDVSEVELSIPQDRGAGSWQKIFVSVQRPPGSEQLSDQM